MRASVRQWHDSDPLLVPRWKQSPKVSGSCRLSRQLHQCLSARRCVDRRRDPMARRPHLRELRGHTPRLVALTHCHPDHQGAAKAVCDTFGIPLACHRADVPAMEGRRRWCQTTECSASVNGFGLVRLVRSRKSWKTVTKWLGFGWSMHPATPPATACSSANPIESTSPATCWPTSMSYGQTRPAGAAALFLGRPGPKSAIHADTGAAKAQDRLLWPRAPSADMEALEQYVARRNRS